MHHLWRNNCHRYRPGARARVNMLDLDLTSPGHSRSKQMPPNERPYMTSNPSLIIHLAVSARVTKLRPSEICLTSIWPFKVTQGQRQCRQMKPHIYDFLCIINSNSVVILNRFGDIGHWKPVTSIDHWRSDNGAKWNLIYDILSITNSNSVVILNRFGDIGYWKPVWPGPGSQSQAK